MEINQQLFINWAKEKFQDIIISGDEIKVNDPWWINEFGMPDREHKCWVNMDKCCFNAFKSKKSGHLIEFVMFIEKCDWEEASEIVGADDGLYNLEKKLISFLESEKPNNNQAIKQSKIITLPKDTISIQSCLEHPVCFQAKKYLDSRKIPLDGLMVCLTGRYKNRILIPYYDKNGNLIYFNTRGIPPNDKIRYLGPDFNEFKVGKGSVLWMSSWPIEGSKIYLTEGEFDAIALSLCGYNSGACGGKNLSDEQIKMLLPYRIALAFDSDKAGDDVYGISQKLLLKGPMFLSGSYRITMIRPPKKYKDWNNFYKASGVDAIKFYINKYEKNCDQDTLTKMRLREL